MFIKEFCRICESIYGQTSKQILNDINVILLIVLLRIDLLW